MPPTDTSEAGLEVLIVRHLTGTDGLGGATAAGAQETPQSVAEAKAAGSGWFAGHAGDYGRAYAVDIYRNQPPRRGYLGDDMSKWVKIFVTAGKA